MRSRIVQRTSPIHGNGVFAARDLPAEMVLVEYRGKRRTHAQAFRLYAGSATTGHTFLFTLNERYVIDANIDGNVARWINHSCHPNCEALSEEITVRGRKVERIVIQTLRPIQAGEEITFDYGIVLDERHSPRMKRIWACRCGSDLCSGTLLHPRRGRRRPLPSASAP